MTLQYLDAGTGSMIASALTAGAAGAAVVARTGWKRVTSPFRKNAGADDTSAAQAESAEERTSEHSTVQ